MTEFQLYADIRDGRSRRFEHGGTTVEAALIPTTGRGSMFRLTLPDGRVAITPGAEGMTELRGSVSYLLANPRVRKVVFDREGNAVGAVSIASPSIDLDEIRGLGSLRSSELSAGAMDWLSELGAPTEFTVGVQNVGERLEIRYMSLAELMNRSSDASSSWVHRPDGERRRHHNTKTANEVHDALQRLDADGVDYVFFDWASLRVREDRKDGGWTDANTLPDQLQAVQVWCPENLCQYTAYWDWTATRVHDDNRVEWYIFGTRTPVPCRVTKWKNLGPNPQN